MFEGFVFCNCCTFIILSVVFGYLIGCINSSIVVSKILGFDRDIRSVGSGNAGFTNVLRTMGKKPAFLTFAGDFCKGVLAVWLGRMIASLSSSLSSSSESLNCIAYLAGFACILGHIYPCFFKFKGGKGVLTTWAVTLLIDWRVFFIIISVFLITLLISKIVSLSSLAAAVSYPVSVFLMVYFSDAYSHRFVVFSLLVSISISCVVILKHKKNILRILNHEEKRIFIHK